MLVTPSGRRAVADPRTGAFRCEPSRSPSSWPACPLRRLPTPGEPPRGRVRSAPTGRPRGRAAPASAGWTRSPPSSTNLRDPLAPRRGPRRCRCLPSFRGRVRAHNERSAGSSEPGRCWSRTGAWWDRGAGGRDHGGCCGARRRREERRSLESNSAAGETPLVFAELGTRGSELELRGTERESGSGRREGRGRRGRRTIAPVRSGSSTPPRRRRSCGRWGRSGRSAGSARTRASRAAGWSGCGVR